MDPTSILAPGASPLAVLGCGFFTVGVAAGLSYLVGSVTKPGGLVAGIVGAFAGLAIMLQLFLK
ncbi:hypothetical protein [Burkholderia cenocepacia]|uniref:hypothetical protein n=1 Tax=Burkholderia cenocepacia TaxID=95486 RepID=UPI00196A9AD6|nr:hypothetical protein [Burkholderia cenocepacia]MBN3506358.1 hypothetical protein [Burkholderia cenocepacia]